MYLSEDMDPGIDIHSADRPMTAFKKIPNPSYISKIDRYEVDSRSVQHNLRLVPHDVFRIFDFKPD